MKRPHRWLLPSLVLAALMGGASPGQARQGSSAVTRAPDVDFRDLAGPYAGPGREVAQPARFDEVKIAYFGPSDPSDPLGGDCWVAACCAIERANRDGGYRGKPFRLIPVWSRDPWGSGVGELARLVYRDEVWAIVGGVESASTHLAEQVVAKARIPMVAAVCGDRTANAANVAWFVSVLPGDPAQAAAIQGGLAAQGTPFALVSGTDHDSRMLVGELQRQWRSGRDTPACALVIGPREGDAAAAARTIAAGGWPRALIVADAPTTAALVRSLRASGYAGEILGGPAMGRRWFQENLEPRARRGLRFPLLFDPSQASERARDAIERRLGHPPDYAAAHMYDSVSLLVEAVRRAGLNRALIADQLRAADPWQGLTGTVSFDALGGNRRAVALASDPDGGIAPSRAASATATAETTP